MQNYATSAGRINKVKGETLAHAMHVEVLSLGCKMKPHPKNKGDNVIYRRWLPFGATAVDQDTENRPAAIAVNHILAEGVTPTADTMTPVDVQVTLQQYGCLYSYSDKTAELYEDDIPEEMKEQVGERMGLVREMIRYGELKSCTNVIFAGGTTRATVDLAISLNIIRRSVKTLKSNHAKKKTRILSPSPNYDTSAIEGGYCVFVHTDAEPDIRDLPNFVPVSKYANRSPINENELGSCEEFRFITSPELAPYLAGGAAVGATGLVSVGAANVDVYPYIVMGEEAAFDVALRGLSSFNLVHLPHTQKDKSDPLGQRGYVGSSFWSAVKITNQGWMALIEAGVTDV
ncbi:MAG: N4-gp56 family major capsid protein [Lysobacterales bacterium]|nr:MAG: N4-gp56 family major capsid protein [Xanthomonadales bacterium]